MALYSANIPPLAAVANLLAQPLLAQITAPAIVAGTPHDGADLDQAVAEYELRRALQASGFVTVNELRQARIRMRAIEAEFAAAAYPLNVVAPGQTQRAVRQLQRTSARLKALEAQARGMLVNLNQTTLQLRLGAQNAELRVLNQIAADAVPASMPLTHVRLQPFVSVDGMLGNEIVPRDPNRLALPPVAAGMQIPSPPFPTTFAAIGRMTIQDINDLSVLMNSGFGIDDDDLAPTWRAKLRRFLSGQV